MKGCGLTLLILLFSFPLHAQGSENAIMLGAILFGIAVIIGLVISFFILKGVYRILLNDLGVESKLMAFLIVSALFMIGIAFIGWRIYQIEHS
jgi:glucan phosphoethanolaminetransferase (alkaline phosphatase superfamily)